jgi:glycosyltransferase involved in cell wall biosynthesis
MSTLVSIVVPVYNVELLVGRCISSLCRQSYNNLDIIIVNDGSLDNSLAVVNKYKKDDVRIQIIDQLNQGLSGARNTGIDAAKGEYILFVDSDDIIEETLVGDCIDLIERDKSDIIVYGYKKVNEDMSIIAEPNFGNHILSKDEALQNLLSLKISPMACNKFIKTSILKENNIVFPLNKLHEDVGTMYKIFWHANQVSTTSKSYYYWINREDSITGMITYKHINHLHELLIEKKVFLKDNLLYNKYQLVYNFGVLKLINLMLERSLNTSQALVEYIYYIINSESLITKDNIEKIREEDKKTYLKFLKLKKEAKNFIENKSIDLEDFYALQKQNRYLTEQLDKIHKTSYYKVFMKYKDIRDLLFPKGSKSREFLKKLKGKNAV